MSLDNDALIRRWFDEVWNKGRVEAIDEMLTEDCLLHGLSADGQPVRGPSEFRTFHEAFYGSFPNIEVIVEDTISRGDRVCSVRCTHTGDSLGFAATNLDTQFTGIAIVRVENGKFAKAWNNFDFMTMHKQLGTI